MRKLSLICVTFSIALLFGCPNAATPGGGGDAWTTVKTWDFQIATYNLWDYDAMAALPNETPYLGISAIGDDSDQPSNGYLKFAGGDDSGTLVRTLTRSLDANASPPKALITLTAGTYRVIMDTASGTLSAKYALSTDSGFSGATEKNFTIANSNGSFESAVAADIVLPAGDYYFRIAFTSISSGEYEDWYFIDNIKIQKKK